MYLKLHCFIHLAIALAVGMAAVISAQAQGAAPVAAAETATLHGHVTDQTGALIPGATVTLATPAGATVRTVNADKAGSYIVRDLAPGGYILQTTVEGFAPFISPEIQLTAGQVKRVEITMAIQSEQQSVVVTDESPMVNVEAAGNANSIVIKGKDLDALSDDPDELSSELDALAGPSAGPNGGQIYIDGFTGGQLPPKSAIREIRINQNPFSAEFDRLGYGRIEILTKPGTDKLHGRFFIQGNQKSFNTGNPFSPNVPAYYRLQYNGTVSGSLTKGSSFFLSVEQRDNHDEQIYTYTPAVLDTITGLYSLAPATVSGTESNPHNHINVSPRVDLQLGQKNTLTVRYQFYYNSESGDIQSTQLPSQSVNTSTTEHTFQISDSQILSERAVNETRFEYRRAISSDVPTSTLPTLMVSGDFTDGGASSQSSNDHTDHFELQNITTMSLGRHALKFGTWLRDNRDANSSYSNRNGSLVFSEQGYIDALNALANHQSLTTLPRGDFSNLSITAGKTDYVANVFDAALFVQDDWKVNPRLTLSGGLRWESQNHIADHNDWAPRVAMAYALDAHNNKPAKTVLRAGFGFFYDRFNTDNLLNATRQGVDSGQVQLTTSSPACVDFSGASSLIDLSGIDFSGCIPAAPYAPNAQSTIVEIAPHFHSPYTEQFGASIERQLTKSITVTTTYLHSFGVHQLVTRDANAYPDGTYIFGAATQTATRPDPSLGIIQQYYPEAVFKQNQMILNVNAKLTKSFSVFGFYNLSFANSNGAGGTASNSYNLNQDYGRASFVRRNMAFLMASYNGPWGIRFNPFLMTDSGRPFNIVTGNDLTGDAFMNSRPAYANASECTSGSNTGRYIQTSYGCFDTTPAAGTTPIPINKGNSPASLAINLRLTRSFGIGPKLPSAAGQDAGGPPGGGPPGGGHGGHGPGGPGGGLGPGGLGGGGRGGPGGMFGSASSDRKYSLSFSAQALNLFNSINYGTPVGTVGSTQFGKSTSLAGGPFSSGSASRRVFVQAIFSF